MNETREKLERLNAALAEAARALETAEGRLQKNEKMKRHVSLHQARIFASSLEFDAAAASVADAGEIPSGLMSALRSGGLRPFPDPDDAAMAEEYDDTRRTHELLREAISLLKRQELAAEKASASRMSTETVKGLRNFFRRSTN